jgi:hypothetical protein
MKNLILIYSRTNCNLISVLEGMRSICPICKPFQETDLLFLSPHQILYVFSIPYKVSLAATVCERAAAFVFCRSNFVLQPIVFQSIKHY